MDPVTLQDLLNALASGGKEALAALLSGAEVSPEVLAELESAAYGAFDEIKARQKAGLTPEDVAALEQLADSVDAIRAETGRREEAAQAIADHVNALDARIRAGAGAGDGTGTGEEGAAGEGAEGVVEGDGAGEGAGEGAEGAAAGAGSAGAPAPEPVTAAGPRRAASLAAIAARSRKPSAGPNTNSAGVLTAAANVPGVGNGATYRDLTHVAEAAIAQFGSYPKPGSVGRASGGLAILRKEFDEALVASGGDEQIAAAVARAVDQSKLKGNSLTAAGGWCAPSEILYDLCEPETTAGLISVPEIVAGRGGFQWTTGPDFREIFTHSGYFLMTEAQADAGDEKPCFEIPCEDFQECRLDAMGVCLSAGILTNRAWPELIARFIRGTLTAHAHKYAAETIRRMVAGSTAVALPPNQFSAAVDTLGALELQAWDYRYSQRLDPDATIELIAPYWFLGVLRSDYAHRNAVDDPYSVSDAEINAWLNLRGFAVQWVYNWQDGMIVPPGGTVGGTTPPTTWPPTVQLLMYAAGTWVRATQDIITINTLYDSSLLRTNRYNALFTEEGLCVMKRCHDSRVLTIPICPTGRSGEQAAVVCPSV